MIKRVSAGIFFLVCGVLSLYDISFAASFLHAPHDEAHGVTCVDCHEFFLDDAASWGVPQNTIDDTVKSFICLRCHGPAGNAPTKAMHSDLSLNGSQTWTTECTDCHSPHFQRQLAGVADINEEFLLSDMYLVTGTITSITPAGENTVIAYTLGSAAAKWSDPADWSAKTGDGRGLIFVADASHPKGLTYETIAADAESITVLGSVDPAMVNKIFGLFYGQFLRNKITTFLGDQTVKFFNPYGGFVDDSGAVVPTGICQVCHTKTLYWTNYGQNNIHNALSRCTLCHEAAQGFKFTGHDHTLTLSSSIGCGDCHTNSDVEGQVHFGNCDTCHASQREEVINAIAAGTAVECITCHVSGFTTLHTPILQVPDVIHGAIVITGTASCASCHSDPPPLVDSGNPKIHDACITCHGGINGTLSGLAAGIEAPGNCATCHFDPFETIHAGAPSDHSSLVTAIGTQCIGCHTSTALVDALDPKVHNSCQTCHDANGGLISLAAGGKTFAQGGNCTTCHTDSFYTVHSPDTDHTPIVNVGTTECAGCHSNPPPLVDDTNPKIHNACTTCHGSDGELLALAEGKTFAAGGDCATCHIDPFSTTHTAGSEHIATLGSDWVMVFAENAHDDVMVGDGKVFAACGMCHNSDLRLIHDNQCSNCHPSPFNSLQSSWTQGCQQGGCHTTIHEEATASHWTVDEDCTQCHGIYFGTPTASKCANCHNVFSVNDTTPPVTTSDAQPSYIGQARIAYTVTDSGKVGIGTTYSRVDGGDPQTGSTITITSAGSHSLELWSVDQAGNIENQHHTANFTIIEDTTSPVTSSNAQSSYFGSALIRLTATDNGTYGVKTTHYAITGDLEQTGTGTSIALYPSSGIHNYTIRFWSEDWSGNEEDPHTVDIEITSGYVTLRLVWGDSGLSCLDDPSPWADWYIDNQYTGGTSCAITSNTWEGINDVLVPVRSAPYHVMVEWYYDGWEYYDQTDLGSVDASTPGTVIVLHY
ncbi:MAG: hypothetical protein KQH63_14945 [Desulfobulbaceae bacterium]|nr:hypothetical protein [Desulfobulbaceae bacterium]